MIRFYSFEGSSGWGSDNASEWDEFIGLSASMLVGINTWIG
jgi:hypothetical protein